MAESIFTVLATRSTSTTVPFMGKVENEQGKLVTVSIDHTIPDELFPTDEEFENPEKLIEWATETNCMFEMLQKGVGKALIEVRAKFKAPKKGKDGEPDTWTPEYGQENVDAMKWAPVKRPNQSNNDKAVLETVLKENTANYQTMIDNFGADEDKITELLTEKFAGVDIMVQAILKELVFA